MSQEQDTIKLAEAMGWTSIHTITMGTFGTPPTNGRIRDIPDPLADANDDYAVLEWLRENCSDKFGLALNETTKWEHELDYHVGDYARAALRVLDELKPENNNG